MSLFLTIPISGQGTITDTSVAAALPSIMGSPFGFTDLFLYSHGWWTSAESAMIDYNAFSIGVSRIVLGLGGVAGGPTPNSLGIGLHWPAILSEDSRSILNVLQPLSFFNRARMADIVGSTGTAALLRMILTAPRPAGTAPPRVHLIGHSFGCKVVCAALQALAPTGILAKVTVNVALIEAAFDTDGLAPGKDYGDVFSKIPQLRMLVTKSNLDLALKDAYFAAGAFNFSTGPTQALGYAGPSPSTPNAATATRIGISLGFSMAGAPKLTGPLVIADLTQLHKFDGYPADAITGHHTDIFRDEIYRLLVGFLFPA